LRLLFRNKVLIDTVLKTNDGYREDIHWQVISALCPELISRSKSSKIRGYYEQSMCRNLIEVPEDIDGFTAANLINCAYGLEVIFNNKEQLLKFYHICTKYSINIAIEICLDKASKLVDVKNCIDVLELSLSHQHKRLFQTTYSMIRDKFKSVICYNQRFNRLDFDILLRLLKDDSLNIGGDEEVGWLAVICWLEQSESEHPSVRAKRLSSLLRRMRSRKVGCSQQSSNISGYSAHTRGHLAQYGVAASRQRRYSMQSNPLPTTFMLDSDTPLISTKELSEAEKCADNLPFEQVENSSRLNSGSRKSEDQILELLKCLRFLRFRSSSAFDAILSYPMIEKSERLKFLIENMRLRYRLYHNISLSNQDRNFLLHLTGSSEGRKIEKLLDRLIKDKRLARGDSDWEIMGKRVLKFLLKSSHLGALSMRDQSIRETSMLKREILATPRQEGAKFSLNGLRKELDLSSMNLAQQPRIPRSVGLLFGGFQDGAVCDSLLSYDFIYNRWFKLKVRLPEPRAFHATCSTQTNDQVSRFEIFIMGGTNGRQILNSVLRLSCTLASGLELEPHVQRLKFRETAPMGEKRCHLTGVTHNGRVYALGGHNGSERLKLAERYEPASNEWHRIADMSAARSDASACSHDGKIFIAGGQQWDHFIQSSVEFYKSSDNSWTFAAPLIIPRMSFNLVSYKGHLLALGGTNGLMLNAADDVVQSVTRSVERYHPSSAASNDHWSFCSMMGQKRCSFGSMLVDRGDRLLVVAGHNGRRRIRVCEELQIGHLVAPVAQATDTETAAQRPRSAEAIASEAPAPELQPPIRRGLFSPRPNRVPAQPAQTRAGPRGQAQAARSVFMWTRRAGLPERRSGFSVVVLENLSPKQARRMTYYGSLKGKNATTSGPNSRLKTSPKGRERNRAPCTHGASLIKLPSRWDKFKLIKRRKLKKHLKIALVLSVIVLLI